MRNLEPTEYRSLVESYEAVYDENLRTKLEEEKELTEFYEFVESLLEEGYDLSEYSYDDLCEYYIAEGGKGQDVKAALGLLWGATKKGIRKGLKIPAGKSTAGESARRVATSAGHAAGSTAKGIYDIGKGVVGTTGRTIRNLAVGAANKPVVALPTVAGLVDLARNRGNSWTAQTLGALSGAAQGRYPQLPSVNLPTRTAKPEPEKPRKLIPGLKESDQIKNIISESPDWNSAPKPKGVAVLTLGGEKKVYIPGLGWSFPNTARNWARKQGYENWDKIPNPSQPPKQRPAAAPSDEGSRRSGESLQDFARRQSGKVEADFPTTRRQPPAAEPPKEPPAASTAPSDSAKPTPASTAAPESPKPAAEPPKAPPAASTAPARAPQPTRTTPAPKPSLQTGDRTKDLTTWAQANKGMIQKVGTAQQKAILSAAEKGTAMPAPRPLNKSVKESYDAFDLVLEYLLSQGHVDTLDEALYVMMEMSSNTIQSIVEQVTGGDGNEPPMGGGSQGYDDEPTPKKIKAPPKPQPEPEPVLLAKSKQTKTA